MTSRNVSRKEGVVSDVSFLSNFDHGLNSAVRIFMSCLPISDFTEGTTLLADQRDVMSRSCLRYDILTAIHRMGDIRLALGIESGQDEKRSRS
jgi:hypothetical protein